VHELDPFVRIGFALLVDEWDRLDGHRVRDDVLDDVANRCEESAQDKPGLDAHIPGHRPNVADEAVHDADAERDDRGGPSGIFSAQGIPTQKLKPARKAAESSRYSLTKNVPTIAVSPDTPAAR
jgi:hypothetical protein